MDENRVTGWTAQDEPYLTSLAANETKYAVYVTDAAAHIIYINHVFTRMLGYEPAEVMGRRVRDVLRNTQYSDADYNRIWAELGRGRPVQEEVRTHDKNGKEVWLSVMLHPVFNPDGSFKHLVGNLEDTTEGRKIEALQRDVLEAVAHEMPLADVMNLICTRVEGIFPEVVSSILSVDHECRLRHLAAPSLPTYYGAAIDGLATAQLPDPAVRRHISVNP